MARRDPSSHSNLDPSESLQSPATNFAILQELERLQEILLDSFHLPLTRWTVVDEGRILDQLEIVHDSVPVAVQNALQILEQKEAILAQAKDYADHVIQKAQQDAVRILDESGIIQQAEQQAYQIRRQVQQECEAMQRQTVAEVNQLQQVTTQEIQQIRQQAAAECQEIQEGADRYADSMLTRLEQQLGELLSVVHNGRQQLYDNSPNLNLNSNTNPNPKLPKKPPGKANNRRSPQQ
jgi:cell division septum initiation protein DivIVA